MRNQRGKYDANKAREPAGYYWWAFIQQELYKDLPYNSDGSIAGSGGDVYIRTTESVGYYPALHIRAVGQLLKSEACIWCLCESLKKTNLFLYVAFKCLC